MKDRVYVYNNIKGIIESGKIRAKTDKITILRLDSGYDFYALNKDVYKNKEDVVI